MLLSTSGTYILIYGSVWKSTCVYDSMPVLLMTNFKVMLTIIRDYPARTRAIRNDGDYQAIFGPMPEVERQIPSRIQSPRGSTHGTQVGDFVTVYTDLYHMDRLTKTYGPPIE